MYRVGFGQGSIKSWAFRMKDGFTFHVTPASAERLAATAAATSLLPARVSSLVAHALRQRFEDDLAQRRKLFEHHREVIRTATPVLTRIGRRHGESTDYGREVGVPRAHAAQGCADLLKQQPASPNLNRIHSLAGLRAGSGLDACIVRSDKISADVMDAGKDTLKIVVRAGAGVDTIDLG